MRTAPEASSFPAVWWLIHGLVISAMAVAGVYLGQWLVAELMQPVPHGDITAKWWDIFRKFTATITGTMFLAGVIGYVMLILPEHE